MNITSAFCLYVFAKHWLDRTKALVVAFAYLIYIPIFHGQFVLTEPFVVGVSLISLKLLVRWLQNKKWLELFLAGTFAAMAGMFKQVALALVMTELIMILLWGATTLKKKTTWLLIWIGGVAWPVLAIITYFSYEDITAQAFGAVIGFYIFTYRPINPLAHPLYHLQLLLPLMVPLWIILNSRTQMKQRGNLDLRLLYIYLWMNLPLVLFRPYHHYWLPIVPIILLLAVILLNGTLKYRFILLLNISAVAVSTILYSYFIQYPIRLAQLRGLNKPCNQLVTPIEYYVNNCPVPLQLVEY